MLLVTKEDASDLIKTMNCTPTTRVRGNKEYLYARRRVGKDIKETCISPMDRLPRLTTEDVQEKLHALLRKVELIKRQSEK